MLEIYNRKVFENNSTKKNNQEITTINENTKYTQNIIKFNKIKNILVKMILKIEFYKIKFLRNEQ